VRRFEVDALIDRRRLLAQVEAGQVTKTRLGHSRCPFLALWKQPRSADGGKEQHKAKAKIGLAEE
jgi:hypothetical protein